MVQEMVREILLDFLKVDEKKVNLNAQFLHDFGCDSLDSIELIVELEESFGVKISDDEASELVTVGDVVNYIEQKISQ